MIFTFKNSNICHSEMNRNRRMDGRIEGQDFFQSYVVASKILETMKIFYVLSAGKLVFGKKLLFPSSIRISGFPQICHDRTEAILVQEVNMTSVSDLKIRVHHSAPVSCIQMTIFQMNEGETAKIGNLSVYHQPLLALEHKVVTAWQGNSPSLNTICQRPRPPGPGLECQRRKSDDLYSLAAGLNACHCDQLCGRFHDCCQDFLLRDHREFVTASTKLLANTSVSSAQEQLAQHAEEHGGEAWEDEDITAPSVETTTAAATSITPSGACLSTEFPIIKMRGIGFYLINTCLPEFYLSEVEHQCRFEGRSTDRIYLLHLPVEVDGLAYRNAYCAICNRKEFTPDMFWQTTFESRIFHKCAAKIEEFKENITDPTLFSSKSCQQENNWGVSYPQGNFLSGASRNGKLCIISGAEHDVTETSFMLMHFDHMELVSGDCFCQFCEGRARKYLSVDMEVLVNSIIGKMEHPLFYKDIRDDADSKGPLWNLFLAKENGDDDDDNDDDDEEIVSSTDGVMRWVSLTGTSASILSLSCVIVHLVGYEKLGSGGKRCQLGMALSKLLFFAFLGAGVLFRSYFWACKILAGLTHYALLVSFCQVVWFGCRVAAVLWQVNNDMAALAVENQRASVDKKEIITTVVVWIGGFLFVLSCWCFDHFVSDSFFAYGLNESCLVNGGGGRLYFVVVPTAMMIVVTMGTIAFSVVQFLAANNKLVDREIFAKFLKFLGKLVAFQSVQWILGIVLYFTLSQVCKYVFEILVSFEGVYMTISYFWDKFFK